jgi:hypothetical protein
MNAGSRDEKQMLANIGRVASALERIANTLELAVYGVSGAQVRDAVDELGALRARDDVPAGESKARVTERET